MAPDPLVAVAFGIAFVFPRANHPARKMRVVDAKYGLFPEVNHLNSRFVPNRPRLKLTVDTLHPEEHYIQSFPYLAQRLIELFPTLRHHRCCEEDTKPTCSGQVPIRRTGQAIDVVHLIEHVIIDLQCHITSMDICSGITCHYWEPENRYDIFVECLDEKVGLFSARLAVDLVGNYLRRESVNDEYHHTIALAKFLYHYPQATITPEQIAQHLGWAIDTADAAINHLVRFQFFTPDPSLRRN